MIRGVNCLFKEKIPRIDDDYRLSILVAYSGKYVRLAGQPAQPTGFSAAGGIFAGNVAGIEQGKRGLRAGLGGLSTSEAGKKRDGRKR